jgi:PHD/YefM family antitoxin component YafN of YafNO toxin-antitoxin module
LLKLSVSVFEVHYVQAVQKKYRKLVMRYLSAGEARSSFADTLNQVAYASERVAIQRPGKEPVYMISAKDYELFLNLLQQAEDNLDLQVSEERMADPDQERVSFEAFFSDLGV